MFICSLFVFLFSFLITVIWCRGSVKYVCVGGGGCWGGEGLFRDGAYGVKLSELGGRKTWACSSVAYMRRDLVGYLC